MILTEDELETLTDYRKPACQKRWLAEHGIPFVEGASGKPKVLRSIIEGSGPSRPTPDEPRHPRELGPWDHEGLSPMAWMEKHKNRFILSRQEIMRRAIPYRYRGMALPGSGVYFLIEDDSIVYVGKATCIASRAHSHRSDGKPFNRISCISCPRRLTGPLESFYIAHLEPSLNILRPHGPARLPWES